MQEDKKGYFTSLTEKVRDEVNNAEKRGIDKFRLRVGVKQKELHVVSFDDQNGSTRDEWLAMLSAHREER